MVLITLNEERNIDRCLGSVRWADEIVVVDSFSTDTDRRDGARYYSRRVVQHEYPGSSQAGASGGSTYATRRVGLRHRCGRGSDPRAGARRSALLLEHDPDVAGFDILRKARRPSDGGSNTADGSRITSSGSSGRDRYRVNHQEVHGGFEPTGARETASRLAPPSHLRDDLLLRGEDERLHLVAGVEQAHVRTPACRPLARSSCSVRSRTSSRMFISRRGYRDGFHGFVLALLDATYTMLLYAKIWEYRMREREGRGIAAADHQRRPEQAETERDERLHTGTPKYLRPYGGRLALSIACSILFSVFSGVSIYLTIPLLETLFQRSVAAGRPRPRLPAPSCSRAGVRTSGMGGIHRFQDIVFTRRGPKRRCSTSASSLSVAFFLKNLFGYLQSNLMTYVEQALVRDLRNDLYRHIHELPLAYFTNERTGNLISRVMNDVNVVNTGISATFYTLIREPLLVVVYLVDRPGAELETHAHRVRGLPARAARHRRRSAGVCTARAGWCRSGWPT